MLKQTIHYIDYNDQPREVTEFFHLNEAEIVDMQAKSVNGIQADMQEAILSNDAGRVLDFIKDLVHRSYGKKSADGVTFEKSPEILQRFINSAYYSDFLLGLIQDNGQKGQDFVRGIMPAKLVERAAAQVQGQNAAPFDTRTYEPSARERFDAAQAASAESGTVVPPNVGSFGQPSYPQFTQPQQPLSVQENPAPSQNPQAAEQVTLDTASPEQLARFREWQAQQDAARAAQSAPASPDAFRVREEEPQPMQGLPRPPHEQVGNVQQ